MAPKAVRGNSKYGPNGLFSPSSFDHCPIPQHLMHTLSHAANYSLTKQTWSVYRTAQKMLYRCCTETNSHFSLPLTNADILTFTAWLLNRGVKSSTISSYLSGLRQVHLSKGVDIPLIRSDLISQVLKGQSHLDSISSKHKPTRLPISPTILRILKLEINNSPFSKLDKRLTWLLCTLAFHGSFRIIELLSKTKRTFDVTLKPFIHNNSSISILSITVKSPKAGRPHTLDIVDVFPTNTDLCPVKAYIALVKSNPTKPYLSLV